MASIRDWCLDVGLRGASMGSLRSVVSRSETSPSRVGFVGLASVLLLGGCVGSGCGLFKPTQSVPRSSVTLNDGPSLNQSGDALTGGRVSRSESSASVVIPSGSVVDISGATLGRSDDSAQTTTNAPQTLIRLSRETPLTVKTTTQTAEGARTHEPSKPPTASELATASGTKLFYYVAAFFAVASVFLFYSGHAKAGVFAAIGAGSLPLLSSISQFAASHSAVAFGAVSLSLFVAWYLVKNKNASETYADTGERLFGK